MITRNRKGQYAHRDREYRTPAERKEFQQATADLMARNTATPIHIDVHCQPPSYGELAALEGMKAIALMHKGNAFGARQYAIEAVRLARLQQGS